MATGGSGDVLTGIIAALIAQGLDKFQAASLGVYIHGLAGDYAVSKGNSYSLIASDIIEALPMVLDTKEI
jgi:NAD(P)H-hydrate epimerase